MLAVIVAACPPGRVVHAAWVFAATCLVLAAYELGRRTLPPAPPSPSSPEDR
jgi:hypothetical protein